MTDITKEMIEAALSAWDELSGERRGDKMRSALSAALASRDVTEEPVAVKALDWAGYDPSVHNINGNSGRRIVTKARHPFGVYSLETDDSLKWFTLDGHMGKPIAGPFTGDAAAKAAAEDDFETRVLSCLSSRPLPLPSEEKMREALEGNDAVQILRDILDYNATFPHLPGEITERARRVLRAALKAEGESL